jgi:DNA-binding PadR family transcriptional regulator
MVRVPFTTELALLGFLSEKPMHGYEIHQRMSDPEGLGRVWQIKQSQLYALLGKLEGDGYLTTELQSQEARPPRKVFHLTELGAQVFEDWVHGPVKHGRDVRIDFLVKLYFLRREGAQAIGALISAQRQECLSWLDYETESGFPPEALPSYGWFVSQFRTHQIMSTLAWLDQCSTALAGAPGKD